MNHDPRSYCFNCGRVRPTAEMDFVSKGKHRKVCADCREKIGIAREAAKLRREFESAAAEARHG